MSPGQATTVQLLPAVPLTRGYFDSVLPYYFALNSSFITKHLITGPLGISLFSFPLNLDVSLDFTSGKLRDSWVNKTNCFPLGSVIKCIAFLSMVVLDSHKSW